MNEHRIYSQHIPHHIPIKKEQPFAVSGRQRSQDKCRISTFEGEQQRPASTVPDCSGQTRNWQAGPTSLPLYLLRAEGMRIIELGPSSIQAQSSSIWVQSFALSWTEMTLVKVASWMRMLFDQYVYQQLIIKPQLVYILLINLSTYPPAQSSNSRFVHCPLAYSSTSRLVPRLLAHSSTSRLVHRPSSPLVHKSTSPTAL